MASIGDHMTPYGVQGPRQSFVVFCLIGQLQVAREGIETLGLRIDYVRAPKTPEPAPGMIVSGYISDIRTIRLLDGVDLVFEAEAYIADEAASTEDVA